MCLSATNDNSMQLCAHRLNSFQESELENVRTQMQVCSSLIISIKISPIFIHPPV